MDKEILKIVANRYIEKFNLVSKLKGSNGKSLVAHSTSLVYSLENREVEVDRINESKEIIKNSTSVFSGFRGNCFLTMQGLLSFEENREEAFKRINEIYTRLNKEYKFSRCEFLAFASYILYKGTNKKSIDVLLEDMSKAYKEMKQNHKFLTSYDDYTIAAQIAVNFEDVSEAIRIGEECYKYLNENGFSKDNNLQALAYNLVLVEGTISERCNKILLLREENKKNNVKIKYYGLPILALVPLVVENIEEASKEISYISDYLKEFPGFGSFSLGKVYRDMISGVLVIKSYLDEINLDNDFKSGITSTANTAILNIIQAIQTAAIAASAGAAAAAAASSSSSS